MEREKEETRNHEFFGKEAGRVLKMLHLSETWGSQNFLHNLLILEQSLDPLVK